MKLECILERLKTILPIIEKVTGKNLALNILSSILIIGSGKTLKLRATNLDIGLEVELPAKIEKEGIIAVNGAVLNNLILNTNNEKSVFFETKNENLIIKTQNNTSTIKGYSYADFPTIPLISGDVCFDINSKKLLSGIKSVFYSASLSDIKPEISSVYIYPNGEDLFFAATDSFRLAEKKIKTTHIPDFTGIIIPHKNINEIIRVLDLNEGDTKVCFNKNQVSFSYDGVYLTSRLIDGNFPDYKQIIPKEHKTEVVLLKQDFIGALKVNGIFLDKFNQIDMTIKPETKSFSISTKNGDVGETSTNITAVIKGEAVGVSLNYRYLFDVFQSIATDSVSLFLSGNNKPVTIQGVSDQTFSYLVMPLNR